jgi:predicted nucleic acid-binding protein
MDLWIAATALAEGVPVVTRNRDDFKILEQLIDILAI